MNTSKDKPVVLLEPLIEDGKLYIEAVGYKWYDAGEYDQAPNGPAGIYTIKTWVEVSDQSEIKQAILEIVLTMEKAGFAGFTPLVTMKLAHELVKRFGGSLTDYT